MAAADDRMPDTSPAEAPPLPRSAAKARAAVANEPSSPLKEPIRWAAPPLTQARTWAAQLAGAAEVAAAGPAVGFGDSASATPAMQITVPTAATAVKTLCLATHDLRPGVRRGPRPGWRSCGSGP
jgi:hypothetical protein